MFPFTAPIASGFRLPIAAGTLETVGRTAEIVGEWLSGKRDRFVVATEVHMPMRPGDNDRGNSRRQSSSPRGAAPRQLHQRGKRPHADCDRDEVFSFLAGRAAWPANEREREVLVNQVEIVEVQDADFAAMLRGDARLESGLMLPPGGVDEPAVLEHVRAMAARLRAQAYHPAHYMVVAAHEVVGLCGIKHPPSSAGDVEIGYGIAASRRRRGHATAAVAALLDAARRDPRVRAVLAMTAVANTASQRVLAKNGFARIGRSHDPGDGELIVWRIALA